MRYRKSAVLVLLGVVCLSAAAFRNTGSIGTVTPYRAHYDRRLASFEEKCLVLSATVARSNLRDTADVHRIREAIRAARSELKVFDFWARYLEPLAYKKLNGPLPVEWETEVFEKFEKPYRREGAGLTLAWNYLEEEGATTDSLRRLIDLAVEGAQAYRADSVVRHLPDYHHFYLANRLYLLNLAAIYTTGFECPEKSAVIPELRTMMGAVRGSYTVFNEAFPEAAIGDEYLELYDSAVAFAAAQPVDPEAFDHYTFLREYVNPLYALNSAAILRHRVVSRSLIDYSLNKSAASIFGKDLYTGQSTKGLFRRVRDTAALRRITRLGETLFWDPILSGNNARACASCHDPAQAFTDTAASAAFHFNHSDRLPRNTPSLLNAPYNHLLMLDGAHLSLQDQTLAVIRNATEMSGGADSAETMRKVLSCPDYKTALQDLASLTPEEPAITMGHVASAISFYYGQFSAATAPFDAAMNRAAELDRKAQRGFNLFMGKAQCGTCHFVPHFNGVKPPYVGSEFEVLGTPADTAYGKLSGDLGRYGINPAPETHHAFRTGTLRNIALTAPYMHNGVFRTLREVVDFYDLGGGAGRGLAVPNQTLSADPLALTESEKDELIYFLHTLTEAVPAAPPPARLPRSHNTVLNNRAVGGHY